MRNTMRNTMTTAVASLLITTSAQALTVQEAKSYGRLVGNNYCLLLEEDRISELNDESINKNFVSTGRSLKTAEELKAYSSFLQFIAGNPDSPKTVAYMTSWKETVENSCSPYIK